MFHLFSFLYSVISFFFLCIMLSFSLSVALCRSLSLSLLVSLSDSLNVYVYLYVFMYACMHVCMMYDVCRLNSTCIIYIYVYVHTQIFRTSTRPSLVPWALLRLPPPGGLRRAWRARAPSCADLRLGLNMSAAPLSRPPWMLKIVGPSKG